ncbi:hypothetical protein ACYJ80_06160 [Staphylococcus capitis]|uniref:hypothetical protein n=1 Tax=Staphylococcus TaxID=1279 RepID=UPI0003BEF8AD|nr:hypothetical protein [Staphylococcus capitis]MBF0712361.1 hypothetical protein [Staphylococcus capitis]MBF2238602.1 hypothetical protein [Staphylococcus capitis]MBF2241479.1 hypothetical protein [Staphylococcus capitis]MBF2243777.1 hypothetical protein [Staphylococcus capitis]MBF2246912.1 hypothetical protein [Staphylococcus capitis]
MELNEDNFNLLVQSVSELSSVIGENQIETKSISLLFLQMNYGMHSFEKILTSFSRYVSDESLVEIKYGDLTNIIDSYISNEKLVTPLVKYQIINGFANNYVPELKPIVEELQSNVGLIINENFES